MVSLPPKENPAEPWLPSTARFVEVDGIRTCYLQAGEGPAVLLIHGAAPGACAQLSWKHTIGGLAAAGFAVYAYDQPGFGHTGPPRDYSVDYRVAHARAFATAVELSRFHLVGNSVGAYIAARVALEDPRVAKLVLVSSSVLAPPGSEEAMARARAHTEALRAFVPTRENVAALTRQTLFDEDLVTDQLIEERLAMSSGPLYEAHLKRQVAPRPVPLGDRLRQLRSATLIVWGAQDKSAAVERALLLQQRIPGAELHIFDRSAHWVQWDQAARFNRLVADFLRD